MTVIIVLILVLAVAYAAYRRFGLPAGLELPGAKPASSPEPEPARAETARPAPQDKELGQLRNSLRDAYQPQHLARFATVSTDDGPSHEVVFTLYETSIQVPTGKYDLSEQVKATVGSQSEIIEEAAHALERMGDGAVVTGPVGNLMQSTADNSEPDDRVLYFMIEGDRWADSVSCPRGQRELATTFAEDVNRAAADSGRVHKERAERIDDLTGQVETATRESAVRAGTG